MEQQIGALDAAGEAQIVAQRDWVRGHFAEDADAKYASLENKLRLLQTILRDAWIEPSETVKLQSLGVTFGDPLVPRCVIVDDEYGRSPAVQLDGTSAILFP